jgi:hypothetical protein
MLDLGCSDRQKCHGVQNASRPHAAGNGSTTVFLQ